MNDAGDIFVNTFLKVFFQETFSGMNGKIDVNVDLAVGICHIYLYRSPLTGLMVSENRSSYKQVAPDGALFIRLRPGYNSSPLAGLRAPRHS